MYETLPMYFIVLYCIVLHSMSHAIIAANIGNARGIYVCVGYLASYLLLEKRGVDISLREGD